MNVNKRYILFSLTTLFVFVFSLGSPISAQADDSTPPVETTPVETQVPDQPEETPSAATEEPVPTGEPATAEDTSPLTGEETTPVEEPTSLPEILEQAPENTDVVVLDEDGEAEPLATVEAAEAIATSDPFWCPTGTAPVPGANGCTGSFATFTDLLTFLDTNDTGAGYQQNGTIFVTSGAYGGGEAAININGATYGTMQNYSLTLQGGWNPATNTVDSTTSLTAPVTITWNGSVFVNDLSITGTSATGLDVTSNTNLGVDHVSVVVTGSNDAAVLVAGGDVSVTNSSFTGSGSNGASIGGNNVEVRNSSFDNNATSGLFIQAQNDISLDQISASQNDQLGATIVSFAGDVNISNSFFNNNLIGSGDSSGGLFILTIDGNIELDTIEANDNGTGALIGAAGNINIFDSHFDNNVAGSGLNATAEDLGPGPTPAGIAGITITGSTFNDNGSSLTPGEYAAGAELDAAGQITMVSVAANGNHDDGLSVYSGLNTVMSNVTANDNGWTGAYVETACSFYVVRGGQYSNNGPGSDGQGFGIWTNGVANGAQLNVVPSFSGNFTGNVFNENICVVAVAGNGEEPAIPPPAGGPLPRTVFVNDGENLPIPCFDAPAAFTLPSGHRVIFINLCGYNATLSEILEDELPHDLPENLTYAAGIDFIVYKDGEEVSTLPLQAGFTVSFLLPEEPAQAQYSILHWDGTQWLEIDPAIMEITQDGRLEAPVEFTGTYILVKK